MTLTALRHSPFGYGLLVSGPDPQLANSWLEPCRRDVRIRRDLATLLRHVAKTDLTEVSTQFPRFTKPVTKTFVSLNNPRAVVDAIASVASGEASS